MKEIIFILIFILSLQSEAQITFQKKYGGNDYEYGKAIIQTIDSGYAIIGNTNSFGLTSDDIYLLKLNIHGTVLWSKTFGGNLDEEGNSILQTADGGFLIAGSTNSVGNEKKVYLIRTDNNGNIIWSKVIGISYEEKAYSVIETSTGDFVVCGYTTEGVYLIKLESSGNLLWAKSYGNSNSEIGSQVIETFNGDYVIVGKSNTTQNNLFLLRTDVNGNLKWSRSYSYSIGMSVLQTSDNGFIISGLTDNANTDILVLKTDTLGNVLWSKTYGGISSDYAGSVIKNGTDGFIVCASTYSFGGDDAYLMNIDAGGNIIWSNIYGISGAAYANCVISTPDGGFAFCGELGSDIFVVKTDPSGNSSCNQNSVIPDVGNYSVILENGATTVTGGTEFNFSEITGSYATVETTICLNTDNSENIYNESFSFYPNPSDGKVFIEATCIKRIEIIDTHGQNVYFLNVNLKVKGNVNYNIDISGKSKGMYLIKVTTEKSILIRKLFIR